MKVIQIIPQLSSGGAERFVVDLSNELAELGHEVIICVLYPLNNDNYNFYLNQVSEKVKVVSMNKKRGLDFFLFIRLSLCLIKNRPDIIHTHLRAILYSSLVNLFYIRGIHTVHNEAYVEASDWLSRIVRRVLFGTKRVVPITISNASLLSFEKFYGYKVQMINNGRNIPKDFVVGESVRVEFQKYRRSASTRVIVNLAHIDKVKNQVVMAKVAKRLESEGYDFSILFIGAHRQLDYLEELKKEMPSCCFILGERKNPLEYLKEAGAYGLCSLYEGLPISLIEALGVGAIPICTPVGGIVDVITNGSNGLLAESISEDSYYEALKLYLDMNDSDVRKMSKRAVMSYSPFSMTICAENYIDAYKMIKKEL